MTNLMLHITHIYPRFKEIHGGGEPVLINLLNHLTDLGYKNTLNTSHLPNSMRTLINSNVKIRTLTKFSEKKCLHFLLQGFLDLMASFLLAFRIPPDSDIICFHTEGSVPALFTYKLLFRKKQCIYFCFQPPRFAYDTSRQIRRSGGLMAKLLPLFSALYKPFDKFSVRRADKVLTFSSGYKNWIESIYGIKSVVPLPCGVKKLQNPPSLPQYIYETIQKPQTKIILFAGKLIPKKNIHRLINITSIIKKSFKEIKCLIVGDGPCMQHLQKQVRQMNLEDAVIFCGYVDSKKVFAYYSVADLFVILEKNVSFGLSIIEAHSCGLPALAFEGGGPSDIIEHGKNGFLQSHQASDADIANQIVDYLTNTKVMQQMRGNAQFSSQKYTWQKFAEKFGNIASELSNSNGKEPIFND